METLEKFITTQMGALNLGLLEIRADISRLDDRITEVREDSGALSREMADLRAAVIGQGGIASRVTEAERSIKHPVLHHTVKWSGLVSIGAWIFQIVKENAPAILELVKQ